MDENLETIISTEKPYFMSNWSSNSIDLISGAFAKAQAEYPQIGKNRQGHFKYSDLDGVMSEIRPILSKYELSFYQPEQILMPYEKILLRSILSHSSGQWLSSETLIIVSQDGKRSAHQNYGAAMTYHRRYSAYCLLNITISDDPDDKDGDPSMTINEYKNLRTILKKLGEQEEVVVKQICSFNNIKSLEDIPASKYMQIIDFINNKAKS